jgi:alpha-glucosidase
VTTAAADGAHVRTTCTVGRSGDRVDLRAVVTGDGFPDFARERFDVVVHGGRVVEARADGADVPAGGARLSLPTSSHGFELVLAVG